MVFAKINLLYLNTQNNYQDTTIVISQIFAKINSINDKIFKKKIFFIINFSNILRTRKQISGKIFRKYFCLKSIERNCFGEMLELSTQIEQGEGAL